MKINKNLFIALCAALFAAILIIAFLIGKQSAPQKQACVINPRAASLPQINSPEDISGNQPQGSDISKTGNQPAGVSNNAKTDKTGNTEQAQTQTTDAPFKENIKNYFQQMDAIGTMEEISGNSREIATQITQNALNGDYSGIDEMIQKCQRIKTMVAAITPPLPCVEFHAQTLESLNEASAMYADFKNFFQRKDEGMLKSISEKSSRLNSKMAGLDSMQKSIKLKYGIE